MLNIRKEQMEALAQVAIRAFEDRTYAHLLEYFPNHCAILGEARMRQAIAFGWAKSASYGLTGECCIRTYIEFMCLLGSRFDTDPLLPWAREILEDRTMEQVARGDRLYDRAWEYIKQLVPDYRDPSGTPITARFVADLRAVRHAPDDPVGPAALPELMRDLHGRILGLFPAKGRLLGDAAIDGSIGRSIATAARYAIRGQRGLTLFCVLAFVLGEGFHDDLLLPWASAALNDPRLTEERRKVDALYAGGVGCLRAWWAAAHPHGA